jgi:haloalkane dehalogenase
MHLPDYPFTSHYLQLAAGRLHYLLEGPQAGDPIVMVHGNPTWSFFFRKLVLALRDRYRVIAPDHMGMGLSDKPAPDVYHYTLRQRIDDLERLMDLVQPAGPVTLVVHDWGGMIGLGWAVRRLERIGRLVILNTAAFHLPAGKRFPWRLTVFRIPGLGAFLARRLNAFCRGALRACVSRPMPPEVERAYLLPYDSYEHRCAVHRFVKDIPRNQSDPAYPIVSEVQSRLGDLASRPALICWGLRDFVFDEVFLDEWRKYFPQAEVHAIADAGHYLLEDAGDEVARLVRTFLGTHPSVERVP